MKKAIFVPRIIGNLPAWLLNVIDRLTGGLALKYGIAAAKLASLTALKDEAITSINEAEAADSTAQEKTVIQNEKISEARKEFREALTNIQKHSAFEEADMEALGGRVIHDAPDPNTAMPVISRITHLPDLVRFDWIKDVWHGIAIQLSEDGIEWIYTQPDLRSPWEDTRTNKVSGVPEFRYIRFRYIGSDGKELGQWTPAIKFLVEIY